MAKISPYIRDKDSVIGHGEILEKLNKILLSDNIPHAFLFSGNEGVGKATIAYIFSKMILSLGEASAQNNDEQDLFGSSIKKEKIFIDKNIAEKISNKTHPDIFTLEPAEDKNEITIDEIRGLGKFLSLTPAECRYRVAIIDSVNQLNLNSSNALLKILEEPTKNTIIILICNNKNDILETISSRCVEIKFTPPSKKDFTLILSSLGYEKENPEDLYNMTDGSIGAAIEIIEKDVLKLIQDYRNVIKKKYININEINLISKEIKSKEAWNIFGKILVKSYFENAKKTKNIKQLDNSNVISKTIYNTEFQNMDVQDSLKIITKQIKYS